MRLYFAPAWTIIPWTRAHRLFDEFFPRQFHGKHRATKES